MTTQLDLLDNVYAAGVDPETAAILDLMAGDPIHDRDREAIIDAIRASVGPDGLTTANRWRPLIPAWVFSNVVGATVHSLVALGRLVPTGRWVVSDDRKGRNSGKPQRQYEWRP